MLVSRRGKVPGEWLGMESLQILGVRVDRVNLEQALGVMEDFISSGHPHLVVTLGTEMVMAARRDPGLTALINGAELVVPDTVGILWAAKRQGTPLPQRLAGIDLIQALAQRAAHKGWKLYLLGGRPGVAEDAARRLCGLYPGLEVAGVQHGYFDDDAMVVDDIRRASPRILLLALGFPKQEQWFQKHREALGVPLAMGVGGSFDVLAGRVARAPGWMIGLGLEWLYRLLRHPQRAIRMLALPRFVAAVWKDGPKS